MDLPNDNVLRGLVVFNASSRPHQINEDLVGYSDDVVSLKFAGLKLANGIIWQARQGRKNFGFIFTVHCHHKVNIPGYARQAGCDDGKTADYDITRAVLVEFATKCNEISLQRRA